MAESTMTSARGQKRAFESTDPDAEDASLDSRLSKLQKLETDNKSRNPLIANDQVNLSEELSNDNSLLGMPDEIKMLILESYFEDLKLGPGGFAEHNGEGIKHPVAILQTCHKLKDVGMAPFLRKTVFKLGVQMWLWPNRVLSNNPLRMPEIGVKAPLFDNSSQVMSQTKRIEVELLDFNLFLLYIDFSYHHIRVDGLGLNKLVKGIIMSQANELLRDDKCLEDITIRLSNWRWVSRGSDIIIAKKVLDTFKVYTGKVNCFRLEGLPEENEELDEYARNLEKEIDGTGRGAEWEEERKKLALEREMERERERELERQLIEVGWEMAEEES